MTNAGEMNFVFSNREQSRIENFKLVAPQRMPDTLYKPALKSLFLDPAEFIDWVERTSKLEEKLTNLQEI